MTANNVAAPVATSVIVFMDETLDFFGIRERQKSRVLEGILPDARVNKVPPADTYGCRWKPALFGA